MNISARRLLGGLAVTAVGVAGLAAPSRADVPARATGTRNCVTDTAGRAITTVTPAFDGVVTVQGLGSSTVSAIAGDEAETIDGGTAFPRTGFARAVAGAPNVVEVTGPPSTPCAVGYSIDATPANDSPAAAEVLTGAADSVAGTTRAATLDVFDEPQPVPDANRIVWYRWTAPDTDRMRFEVEPQTGSGYLDAGTINTALCLAIYGPDDHATPLVLGGNPVADGQSAHGGVVEVDVTAGAQYDIAVCSGGGTGVFASPHDYTAPGAFTLSWVPAGRPAANDDVAFTSSDFPKTILVLHNDTDPQGDALSITAADPRSTAGGTITPLTGNPNALFYQPPFTLPGFRGVDGFDYTISDGHGGSDTAHVTVYVDVSATQPLVSASPSTLDFGAVPLGKTKDMTVTFTNISASSIGTYDFKVDQVQPEPFDASLNSGSCAITTLQPGDSCTATARFWSVAGADAASPASLVALVGGPFETGTTVQLVASTAPPVPPATPNADPVATDDAIFAVPSQALVLEPLDNDSDPDHDILTITNATSPAHGTAGIVRCRDVETGTWISPQATCVQYTPQVGFNGVDTITYTISDGRGGTDTAVYYIAEDSTPSISAVTPNHAPPGVAQDVVIHGTDFMPQSYVHFICDGVRSSTLPSTTLSSTQIAVAVPAMGVPATCDVEVRYPVGVNGVSTATLPAGFWVGSTPTILPSTGNIAEGDNGTKTLNIPVTLSFAPTQTVTAEWNTVHLNAGNEQEAKPGDDYVAASGTVTFAPGQTSAIVPVTIKGDLLDEDDELFAVSFHDPTNATIGGLYGLGFGRIADDDALPVIVPDFGALSVPEGSTDSVVLLHVSLSAPSGRTVRAHYATPFLGGDGVAEPDDYVAATGDVTFAPGATDATVPITVHGDAIPEEDELVGVSFGNPVNARIGGVYGIGAIRLVNDD